MTENRLVPRYTSHYIMVVCVIGLIPIVLITAMNFRKPPDAASSVIRAACRVVSMYLENAIILTVFILLSIVDVRDTRC